MAFLDHGEMAARPIFSVSRCTAPPTSLADRLLDMLIGSARLSHAHRFIEDFHAEFNAGEFDLAIYCQGPNA